MSPTLPPPSSLSLSLSLSPPSLLLPLAAPCLLRPLLCWGGAAPLIQERSRKGTAAAASPSSCRMVARVCEGRMGEKEGREGGAAVLGRDEGGRVSSRTAGKGGRGISKANSR